MGDILSTGRSAQKRAQKQQEQQIAKARKTEEARLAEETSEVERRKLTQTAGRGGRSLLIQTSQTGVKGATNLGGTA